MYHGAALPWMVPGTFAKKMESITYCFFIHKCEVFRASYGETSSHSLVALSMKIGRQPCTCNGVLGPRNLTQDRQANIPKIAAYKYESLHGTFLCGDSLVCLGLLSLPKSCLY